MYVEISDLQTRMHFITTFLRLITQMSFCIHTSSSCVRRYALSNSGWDLFSNDLFTRNVNDNECAWFYASSVPKWDLNFYFHSEDYSDDKVIFDYFWPQIISGFFQTSMNLLF